MSLAKKHQKKWAAKQQQSSAPKISVQPSQKKLAKKTAIAKAVEKKQLNTLTGDLAILHSQLNNDLERLKGKSLDEKRSVKAQELLPVYLPHLDKYLADVEADANAIKPNQVLVRCAIWAIDCEEMTTALRLCNAAVEQNQLAPAGFKRELAEVFTEMFAEWALEQYNAKQSASPYLDAVIEQVENNTWAVSHPIIIGKLYRHAGLLANQHKEFKAALGFFIKAQAANEKAGCKGLIKQLKKQLGQ